MIAPLRTLAQRCKRLSPLLAAPAALLLSQGQAKAILNYNIFQRGSDVVLSASGSLSLPGVVSSSVNCNTDNGGYVSNTQVGPFLYSAFASGAQANSCSNYNISGSNSFPGSNIALTADSGTGFTSIFTKFSSALPPSRFTTQSGYAGASIVSESIFLNKNLATDFGISTTGLLGTWTLQSDGNGDNYTANDTINLIVGTPPAASVPGPLPLFGAAAAFGWSRRLRKRIATPLSTPFQA